jgi:hypothetical protein
MEAVGLRFCSVFHRPCHSFLPPGLRLKYSNFLPGEIQLASSFHRASLVSINLLTNWCIQLYRSLSMLKSVLFKIYSKKYIFQKSTPTCFGSRRVQHQGVMNCTRPKLHIVVHLYLLLCALSVFDGIIWTCGVCICCAGWRGRLRLKCDGTRAENRFGLSAKRTSPFKSTGTSVQSTTGRRAVHINLLGL